MTNRITDELGISLRDEFVHGYIDEEGVRRFPTVEELGKKHQVARASLYRLSKEEGWQSQKNRYQTELRDQQDKERMESMVAEGKRLDESSIKIAQAMLVTVGRKIQRNLQAEQSNQPPFLSSSDLQHLSAVAANAQKVGKLALGQAQEISKVSANISNPEAFESIMAQLDELAESRASASRGDLH